MTSVEIAINWVLAQLFGPLSVALMALAIAGLGLKMLSGRVAPRQAVALLLGCFILVGAASIADSLVSQASMPVAGELRVIEADEQRELPTERDRRPGAQDNPFSPYPNN